MRRSVRRVLSLCLVLSLTLALCIPAFAAGNVCFENYLMISDSIGVYCGDPPRKSIFPSIPMPVWLSPGPIPSF